MVTTRKIGGKTVENNGRKRKEDGGMETVVYNSISKYMIPNRTLALTNLAGMLSENEQVRIFCST